MVSAVARRSRLIWHSFHCHGRRHWTARRTRAGCGSEHSQRSGLVCHTTAEGRRWRIWRRRGSGCQPNSTRGSSRSARPRPVKPPPALCPKVDWLRSKAINGASIPSMFFSGELVVYIRTLKTCTRTSASASPSQINARGGRMRLGEDDGPFPPLPGHVGD